MFIRLHGFSVWSQSCVTQRSVTAKQTDVWRWKAVKITRHEGLIVRTCVAYPTASNRALPERIYARANTAWSDNEERLKKCMAGYIYRCNRDPRRLISRRCSWSMIVPAGVTVGPSLRRAGITTSLESSRSILPASPWPCDHDVTTPEAQLREQPNRLVSCTRNGIQTNSAALIVVDNLCTNCNSADDHVSIRTNVAFSLLNCTYGVICR